MKMGSIEPWAGFEPTPPALRVTVGTIALLRVPDVIHVYCLCGTSSLLTITIYWSVTQCQGRSFKYATLFLIFHHIASHYITLHQNMHALMHTLTGAWIYIGLHTYEYTHMPTHIHTHTYIYIYIHLPTHTYTYIHRYLSIHTYTYRYTQLHTHAYRYIHTYIYTQIPA